MQKKPVGKVRLTERRRRESYVMYVVYVALIALLFGALAYVTRLPQFRVSEVAVVGAQYANEGEIETLARDTLASTYAFLVPKDMLYVLPQGAIVERVASLPIIESATLSRSGTILTIAVTERTPAARYCADTCFRIDEYGFIFDTVHDDDALIAFRGGALGPADTFLDGRFHDLWSTVRGIETVSRRAVREVVVDGTTDVFVRLEAGGEVRFTLESVGQKLLDDLALIFSSPRMAHGTKFEYIELRFGTKAAVKLVE